MKVLVTGGAGFIGSHVVDILVARGFKVSVLDNLSTGSLHNLNHQVDLYNVDLRDRAEVNKALAQIKPDYLIHHAAQVDVTTSLVEPLRDAETNILGSINLFQEAFKVGVKRVIYPSSAAIYGDPQNLPLTEESTIMPIAPYGISKYAPEHYLRILATQAGKGYTILRYANVYGPRQSATGEGGVVAIFAHRLAAGQPVDIFGDGEQTRDFVYVKDVARANLAALSSQANGIFNIGTGKRISVNQLLEGFERVVGFEVNKEYKKPRPGEVMHSTLAPTKARDVLGWQAQTDLIEGLQYTYQSFRVASRF